MLAFIATIAVYCVCLFVGFVIMSVIADCIMGSKDKSGALALVPFVFVGTLLFALFGTQYITNSSLLLVE